MHRGGCGNVAEDLVSERRARDIYGRGPPKPQS